ncbi:MAG: CoA ester lyase [Alphaproteobacteria bacterium]|nr:CoA ester lyase [Alphaproteobacteria bacterium]
MERAVTGPPLRLERSTLIAPASTPAMLEKAARANADAICMDCEDAVAPDEKAQARDHVVYALKTLDFGAKLKLVRVNALDTPFAYRDIIDIVEAAGDRLDAIVLPKASSRDDIRFLDQLLTQIEQAKGFTRPIAIEALIETAAGVNDIAAIAAASPRLEAFIFGSGDFAASMQMPLENIGGFDAHDALYPGHRWHHAMHAIVTAARANGLRAIDGPYADFKDAEGLTRAAAIARALGFDGKWCIHPSQVTPINQAFAPTEKEIAWAKKVSDAYQAAVAEGRGVISVDGKMIDAANVRMCRAILQKAQAAGLTP